MATIDPDQSRPPSTTERLLCEYRQRVEASLDHWLPAVTIHPTTLHEAQRYAVLGGGKRLRPVLVYATGAALGVPLSRLDAPATAVELVHVYSLVHDDLPAMDDDSLRRGKPTCHKVYGEAMAILVGDALQSLAFQVLAEDQAMVDDAARRLEFVRILAQAAGSRGMAGGQVIDLQAVGHALDMAELEDMHIHKTGALIRASVWLGAHSRQDITDSQTEALDHYAKCIGLAFQIRDDILDETADTTTLGKTQGADRARAKPTYPALLGLAEARHHAKQLCDSALRSLESLDEAADTLRWLAHYIVERSY